MPEQGPFTVVGAVQRCWVFTFQTTPEWASAFLPQLGPRTQPTSLLAPMIHNGKAFWNVVVCHACGVRPVGFPVSLGLNCWYVSYRLHVRATLRDRGGISSHDGLFVVRSDCDNGIVTAFGGLMSALPFCPSAIRHVETRSGSQIHVVAAPQGGVDREDAGKRVIDPYRRRFACRANVRLDRPPAFLDPSLPGYSAFGSISEAEALLAPRPHALFGVRGGRLRTMRALWDEAAFQCQVVPVAYQRWSFFDDIPARPEVCFEVAPMECQWQWESAARGRGSRFRQGATHQSGLVGAQKSGVAP